MTRDLAAIGVQNKFDKIIFSSSTLCSFNTAMAFITVFPVPICAMNKKYTIFFNSMPNILSILLILQYLLIIGYINKTFLSDISSGNLA